MWTNARRPKARVTRVGKGYWVGGFYDFEDGKVLVDKSQLTGQVSFQVPVPAMEPEAMVGLSREANQLAGSMPKLLKRRSASGAAIATTQNPIEGVKARLGEFTTSLDEARGQPVTMNVLANGSTLTRAIVHDVGKAETVKPRNSLIGRNAADVEAQLDSLAKLKATAAQSAGQAASLEELTERLLGELESAAQKVDSIQRLTLVQVLGKQLLQLERAYRAPMMYYYCPNCLERLARDLKCDLDQMMLGHETAAMENEAAGSCEASSASLCTTPEQLSEAVERFSTTTRAAIMVLDRQSWGDGDQRCAERKWHCPLCGERFDLEDGRVTRYRTYRTKQELVLPLWDQLWMELSSERAGLLERKDKEHRDNINHENQETVQAAGDFAAERREVKNRMENLNASTVRALSVFSNLIDSFVDSQLVGRSEVRGDEERLRDSRQEFLAKLDQIDKTIEGIEQGLARECEESLQRRGTLLDYADEVKLHSQFTPPKKDDREQLVITGPV